MKLDELRAHFKAGAAPVLFEEAAEGRPLGFDVTPGPMALEMMATVPWVDIKEALRGMAVKDYGWPEGATFVYRYTPDSSEASEVLDVDHGVNIEVVGQSGRRIRVEGFGGHELPRESTKLRFHIPPYKDSL